MNAKSDADVARGLGISPQALSAFKKKGKFPSNLLIKYCLSHQISIDWILTGEGEKKRGYPSHEGRPEVTTEESPIYNDKGDPELKEIIEWLKTHSNDKKLVSKLIKGRKFTQEAVEGFGIKNLLNEEG